MTKKTDDIAQDSPEPSLGCFVLPIIMHDVNLQPSHAAECDASCPHMIYSGKCIVDRRNK